MKSKSANNAELYRFAKQLIPGGTQLLSKRPELYAPDVWPAYYQEAHGCEILDFDGHRLVDMTTNGVGTCLLGYRDRDVTAAVIRQIRRGTMCSLNAPSEVELAEALIEIHPWSEQVRYSRTGGEAMAVAVRIARAATSREIVAFCGYHGWSDWYLAANLAPTDSLSDHLLTGLEARGVPQGLAGTAIPFRYNRLSELQSIVQQHGDHLAAVVVEPTRSVHPTTGFLEGIRQACDQCGAAMIFDEISSGWRFGLGGVHLHYGIQPDMAVFGKAMGNGHPIAAVIGKTKYMNASQDTFISSTYWTEAVGPVAALATIRKLQRCDVPSHVASIGRLAMDGWIHLGAAHGLPTVAHGHPAMAHLEFDHAENTALGTLFTIRMLNHGFLAGPRFYPTFAHQQGHVERFLDASNEVFFELAHAIERGDISTRLKTPPRQTGFQRITP